MIGVLGHVAVLIPGRVVGVVAVVDLNVAHALLGQATRHQALATVVVGGLVADAIELEGGLGFLRQVEGIRRALLHAPGEFVTLQHRLDLRVARPRLATPQGAEQFILAALLLRGPDAVGDVLDAGLRGRNAAATDRCALKHGGQESVAVVARPAVAEARADGDKAGQVFVFRTQSVHHPGAHARTDEAGGAGVQEEGGRSMRHALGVHAVQEAEVVDVLVDVREQAGGPATRLAVLGIVPERFHQLLRRALAGLGDRARIRQVERLLVVALQARLVVEGVHVADPALHEQEDHALGARQQVRTRQGGAGTGQRRGRQPAETTAGALQEGTTRSQHGREKRR